MQKAKGKCNRLSVKPFIATALFNNILSCFLKSTLDEATAPWGVKVERVEVKDVRVPEQLQRAMAAEAEAAREARAKVIAAEGEHKASRALRHAAEVIADSPSALQVNPIYSEHFLDTLIHDTLVRVVNHTTPH